MTMLSDDRLAYFDVEAGMFLSEDEGRSWTPYEKAADIIPGDGYVNNSSIAPDGSLILCNMQYTEEQKMSSALIGMDASGSRREASGLLADGDYINKVFAKSEKECFGTTITGKVCFINWETGEAELMFTLSEQPEMMTFADTQLLCLGDSGVAVYDLEQDTMLDKDTVLNDYITNNLKGRLNNASAAMAQSCFRGKKIRCIWLTAPVYTGM